MESVVVELSGLEEAAEEEFACPRLKSKSIENMNEFKKKREILDTF
jgi:hypothetical protein